MTPTLKNATIAPSAQVRDFCPKCGQTWRHLACLQDTHTASYTVRSALRTVSKKH
jgi:hypothetical protein